MRIISKSIDFSAQDELLQDIAPLNDFLLLDIETTGLSAEHNAVYLIGCIYHQTDGWNLIQWMDNTGNEEKEVLSSFLLFASGYRILVHYNGDRFDIPFLRKRIELHSLTEGPGAPRLPSADHGSPAWYRPHRGQERRGSCQSIQTLHR